MKKIIIFAFFSAFIFSSQPSLAETYPATCDPIAQSIITGLGGCSAIDCSGNANSNTCIKCCGSVPPTTQTSSCTNFSYSNWSTCSSSSRTQTRTIVSRSPTGCTGGTSITSQSCIPTTIVPPVSTSDTTALISTFTSSKTEIVSGETIALTFSGPSTISKYKIYFSCPKFSTGLNAGLLAASVKIGEVEYCNKDFSVPANTKTQNVNISSKYSKSLKLTIRLKAYDSQDQYTDYKDVIMAVNPASSVNIPATGDSPLPIIPPTPALTQSVGTQAALQTAQIQQLNALIDQLKLLLAQAKQLGIVLLPTGAEQFISQSVAVPASSATSASMGESITETALSNELGIFSYTWNKDLYYGMRNNDDVKALQRALTREGVYFEEITGNFFGLTRQAVIDFQKKNNFSNIPNTGYVGTYTRKVLNGLYSK